MLPMQRDGHNIQAVDPLEVRGIAGVHGEAVGKSRRRDQRIVGHAR
jgi:hypothetical protein